MGCNAGLASNHRARCVTGEAGVLGVHVERPEAKPATFDMEAGEAAAQNLCERASLAAQPAGAARTSATLRARPAS